MTTTPPPPRYRVVEQGRRLVVIDTVTGAPATRAPPPGPDAPPAAPRPGVLAKLPSGPTRTAFDGRATLVTHPLYDAKAPRTLTLSGEETQLFDGIRVIAIGGAMMYAVLAFAYNWLLMPLVLLFNPGVRRTLRAAVTRWLDRYDTPSAG